MYDKQLSHEERYVLQHLSMEVRYGSKIFIHTVTHVWLIFGQSLQYKKRVGLHGKMSVMTHMTYILILYMQSVTFIC